MALDVRGTGLGILDVGLDVRGIGLGILDVGLDVRGTGRQLPGLPIAPTAVFLIPAPLPRTKMLHAKMANRASAALCRMPCHTRRRASSDRSRRRSPTPKCGSAPPPAAAVAAAWDILDVELDARGTGLGAC